MTYRGSAQPKRRRGIDVRSLTLIGNLASVGEAVRVDASLGRAFTLDGDAIEAVDINTFQSLGEITFARTAFSDALRPQRGARRLLGRASRPCRILRRADYFRRPTGARPLEEPHERPAPWWDFALSVPVANITAVKPLPSDLAPIEM